MNTSIPTIAPPPSPADQLLHAWHTVLTLGLQALLALAAGLLAARLLRRLGLHWSWAMAEPLAFAPIAALIDGLPPAPVLLLGAAACARSARRRHLVDLDVGGRRAESAVEAVRPLDLLRRLCDLAAERLARRRPGPRRGRLRLGTGRDGRPVSIPFVPGSIGHTLVVGATGSGKTVTQTTLACQAVRAGLAVVAVDPKGDRDLRDRLRVAAEAAGRGFRAWSPAGPSVYNPYSRGGDTEIADRVLAGERFTEPHYLRQAQRYLGHAIRALRASGREVSLVEIVDALEPDSLDLVLRELAPEQADAGSAYLDSLTPRQLRDLAGVRDRLAILTESDVGRWLDPRTGAGRIELLESIRAGEVVYLNLESDRRPLLSKMLGAAIVQDLQSVVATLQGSPSAAMVLIDEFSAVSAEHVVALFGRARSAGMSLLLGTQELSDLRLPGREQLLEQILGNLSLLIAHRQVVPASAELIGSLCGTCETWRVSWSSDGRTTRTPVSTPAVPAETLTALAPGWGVVIPLAEGTGAQVTHVERPEVQR